jgi:hypothetical protein
MEIYNGPTREVRYYAASPGERSTLSDLERAENELGYVKNLEALKRQYVNSERILEPQRRYVQEQLYGTSISFGWYNSLAGYGYGTDFGRPGSVYPYVFPYNYGGYSYPGFSGYLGGFSTSVTRNLAYGMGDEGRFKDAMVQVIAQQAASPEYMAQAYRNYAAALNTAASNKAIARSLKLGPPSEALPAAIPPEQTKAPVTLILKGGDKLEGSSVREDGDTYVLKLSGGSEIRVPKGDVSKVDRAKPK